MNAPQMNPGRSQLPTYITRIVLLGPYYSTLRGKVSKLPC